MQNHKAHLFQSAKLLLTGLLALSASPSAFAQQATPPAAAEAASKPLDELEDVLISGGRVYDRIVRAEDRLFKLYNELNKDDDYDTNCAFVPIELESRTEQRFCMPAFFADAKAEQVRLSQYCQSLTARDDDGNILAQGPCYEPPSAELVFFARKDAYVDNVLKVINSDPRLQKMAAEVEALHRERASLANQFDALKEKAVIASSEKHKYRPTIR